MTHRIDIPAHLGGGFVEIKEKRSWADVKRIDQRGVRWEGSDMGQMVGKMDLLENGIAKLEAAIVTWSLTDANGSALPPDRGGFVHEDFDPELGDWLIAEIDEFYAGRSRSKRGPAEVEAGTEESVTA